MLRKLYLSLLAVTILSLPCAGSNISIEVFGGGGGDSSTSSYILHGKTRAMGFGVHTGNNQYFGDGFIHSVYGLSLNIIITAVSPSSAINIFPVAVSITGANFVPGITIMLIKPGQSPITGEGITLLDSSHLVCTFNITGKAPGGWNIIFITPDGRTLVYSGIFTVTEDSGPAEVVGRPISYPNPFDPDKGPTTIKFKLNRDAAIDLYIFNISGTRIWERHYQPGSMGGKTGVNEVLWDGINAFTEEVPNGIYVYQVASGGRTLATGKIAVFK